MDLTDDEKMVFKDPFFWALAGLPDPDGWNVDDDDDWEDEEDDPPPPVTTQGENGEDDANDTDDDTPAQVTKASAVITPPKTHELSAEDEAKLRPLFESLVDQRRIELNYGKPVRSPSMNNVVARGLAAFKQVHANVSQYFIHSSSLPSTQSN